MVWNVNLSPSISPMEGMYLDGWGLSPCGKEIGDIFNMANVFPWRQRDANLRCLSSEKRPNLTELPSWFWWIIFFWMNRFTRIQRCMSDPRAVNGNYVKLQLASYFSVPLCRGAGSRRCHAGQYMYHEEHRRATLKTDGRKQFTWTHFTGRHTLFFLFSIRLPV